MKQMLYIMQCGVLGKTPLSSPLLKVFNQVFQAYGEIILSRESEPARKGAHANLSSLLLDSLKRKGAGRGNFELIKIRMEKKL